MQRSLGIKWPISSLRALQLTSVWLCDLRTLLSTQVQGLKGGSKAWMLTPLSQPPPPPREHRLLSSNLSIWSSLTFLLDLLLESFSASCLLPKSTSRWSFESNWPDVSRFIFSKGILKIFILVLRVFESLFGICFFAIFFLFNRNMSFVLLMWLIGDT